jgi:hypothetical protein
VSGPDLRLTTGFLDDPREPLRPRHELYALAAHAHRWQDSWGPGEHLSFFDALLPRWPRERPQTRERRALLAGYLHRACALTRPQIADLLCVAPDTVRRRDLESAGVDLWREDKIPIMFCDGMARWILEEWGAPMIRITPVPRTRVPRVTATAEETPGPPFFRNVCDESGPSRTVAERAEMDRLLTAIDAKVHELVAAGVLVKRAGRLRRSADLAAAS